MSKRSAWKTIFLVCVCGVVTAIASPAQTFTTLHSFTTLSGPNSTNSDGAEPYAGLILSGNALYGTASVGGGSGNGAVFKVNTDGINR